MSEGKPMGTHGRLVKEVLIAANEIGAQVAVLPKDSSKALHEELLTRFSIRKSMTRIWEGMANAAVVRDPNGWRLISEFLKEAPVIMLFDIVDDSGALRFERGSDVTQVLAASVGFEFYLTNDSIEYILAFNHHDFLIGDGSARQWIIGLVAHKGDRRDTSERGNETPEAAGSGVVVGEGSVERGD